MCRRGTKVGHAGTLDPFAQGVLVLGIGQATRLLSFVSDCDKRYRVVASLGKRSDTMDCTGKVIEASSAPLPEPEKVEALLDNFRGLIEQVPPMFSAKKRSGKRLYELARAGKTVERDPVPVRIETLELLRYQGSEVELLVECSKGTYIRSLVDDLGQDLGTGAMCQSLVRLSIGDFELSQACSLEGLGSESDLTSRLLGLEVAVQGWPVIQLSEFSVQYVRDGRSFQPEGLDESLCALGKRFRLVNVDNDLVGLGEWSGAGIHPFRVFHS